MKYIIDEASEVESFIEESLNEASGKTEKSYYITGIFSTPEKQNRNGRKYPLALWEREVSNFQNEINNKTVNSLGEFEHPARTKVDPRYAVMRIVEVKIENGLVKGKAKILNNNSEITNQLKALIDEGIKIGVSSRGIGKIGANNVISEFKLTTWDIVTEPSDYNANLDGLTESLNESIGDKNFRVTESGNIEEVQICTENACHMFDTKTVQEAVKTKFDKILSEMMVLPSKKDNSKAKTNKRQFKATFDYKNPMTNKSQKMSLYFSDKESAEKFADLNYMKILNIKED